MFNTQSLLTKPLQAGDQVVTYLSGSVEGGSPAGLGWHALLPYDWELDVSLTCDLSADPTIKITEDATGDE